MKTDQQLIDDYRFSLLPQRLEQLPSEAVLRALKGEPFWVGPPTPPGKPPVTVWYDEEGFALSGTESLAAERIAYELFETYEELQQAFADEQLTAG